MKFVLSRASTREKGEIEINTLQELIDFKERVGEDLIITNPCKLDALCDYEIVIYDDYIE